MQHFWLVKYLFSRGMPHSPEKFSNPEEVRIGKAKV